MNEKINFFGANIDVTNPDKQLKDIEQLIHENESSYITYSNVHVIVSTKQDIELQKIINNANIASPDGMPLVWIGKLLRYPIKKCSGPDMMDKVLQLANEKGYTSYFYGSTDETLNLLEKSLKNKYPKLKIVGLYSPPFRSLTKEEDETIVKTINDLSPDLVWVGLGAPKQEKWMYDHQKKLNRGVMLGVGAGFDFHAGAVPRAPKWMQSCGLEWFYRLAKEPSRLWKRYFITNTKFVYFLVTSKVK